MHESSSLTHGVTEQEHIHEPDVGIRWRDKITGILAELIRPLEPEENNDDGSRCLNPSIVASPVRGSSEAGISYSWYVTPALA